MCGLVGVIAATIDHEHKHAFRDLLQMDEIRGRHSTGIAKVDKDGNAWIGKEVGVSANLYQKKELHEKKFFIHGRPLVAGHNLNWLMGHNRHATKGEVNAENAHPFALETILGAHNGTLRAQSIRGFNGYRHDEVDSLVFFKELEAKEGNIADVYKRTEGAMALTWLDNNNGTFNLLRNEERTLFYTYSHDRSALFYASEIWMLRGAYERNPLAFHPAREKGYKFKVYNFEPDHLYCVDHEKLLENKKVEVKKTKLEPFPATSHWNWYDWGQTNRRSYGHKPRLDNLYAAGKKHQKPKEETNKETEKAWKEKVGARFNDGDVVKTEIGIVYVYDSEHKKPAIEEFVGNILESNYVIITNLHSPLLPPRLYAVTDSPTSVYNKGGFAFCWRLIVESSKSPMALLSGGEKFDPEAQGKEDDEPSEILGPDDLVEWNGTMMTVSQVRVIITNSGCIMCGDNTIDPAVEKERKSVRFVEWNNGANPKSDDVFVCGQEDCVKDASLFAWLH